MAYAGIQSMLLAYKMRKSDKEFELMQISQKLISETRDKTQMSEDYLNAQAELSKDDPNYAEAYEANKNEYEMKLADIAQMEEDLETQKESANTEISFLNEAINNWQEALKTGIQKAHTYGAQ